MKFQILVATIVIFCVVTHVNSFNFLSADYDFNDFTSLAQSDAEAIDGTIGIGSFMRKIFQKVFRRGAKVNKNTLS